MGSNPGYILTSFILQPKIWSLIGYQITSSVVLFHGITVFPLQLFWRNLKFVHIHVRGLLRKLKKSCFAFELNWTKKVCLQQPAMFRLSNSNVDNKNSVEGSWFLERYLIWVTFTCCVHKIVFECQNKNNLNNILSCFVMFWVNSCKNECLWKRITCMNLVSIDRVLSSIWSIASWSARTDFLLMASKSR